LISAMRGAGALLLAALSISACSVVEEKRQAYRQSESIAPLQLPDSLTPPASADALTLPVLQSRPAAAAVPFDTRPPAPVNLPAEIKPEPKE
jgi:uncharacterized lipoprotein